MTSRSSPWTFSRFLTKKPSSRSLGRRTDQLRAVRERLDRRSMASSCAAVNVTTPSDELGRWCQVMRARVDDPSASTGCPGRRRAGTRRRHVDRTATPRSGRSSTAPGKVTQLAVVEAVVGEGDQGLVPAAVVPAQRERRAGTPRPCTGRARTRSCPAPPRRPRRRRPSRPGRRSRGRQLLLVAGHDQLAAPVDAVHRVGRDDLGGLVEDDRVEPHVGAAGTGDRTAGSS